MNGRTSIKICTLLHSRYVEDKKIIRLRENFRVIMVLTLQPILKLPLLWNVKHLEISIPIILQIV